MESKFYIKCRTGPIGELGPLVLRIEGDARITSAAIAPSRGCPKGLYIDGLVIFDMQLDGEVDGIEINANVLFLNFGSRPRAEEFLARRMSQGMKDVVIKSFNVPRGFLEDVRAAAVRERKSKEYPGRPLIVDETKAPDQFGLRGQWIDRLKEAIIQGSGRIER